MWYFVFDVLADDESELFAEVSDEVALKLLYVFEIFLVVDHWTNFCEFLVFYVEVVLELLKFIKDSLIQI